MVFKPGGARSKKKMLPASLRVGRLTLGRVVRVQVTTISTKVPPEPLTKRPLELERPLEQQPLNPLEALGENGVAAP